LKSVRRLLRLRNEVDKLLTYQASKITDPENQRAFLAAHYEELLQALSVSYISFFNAIVWWKIWVLTIALLLSPLGWTFAPRPEPS